MQWNWINEKRKAQPDAWRIATVVDERLHNAVLNGTLSNACAQRRHDSADLAALSLVLAYRAVNGDRAMTSDEIEGYADLTMAMLNHPDVAYDKGTPICVADNIYVLYGRCGITQLSFAKLYSRFGMDCKVIDLICTPKRELQRTLEKAASMIEQMIKFINIIACEDLTMPNPDEDAMREFVTNIINNIHRAHREGPKERAVNIVIEYYLHDRPIEDLAEMFMLSGATIRHILWCWRERCHTILGDRHSWDAPYSLGTRIFGNSPCNKEYPEFSFLHRIRFLMMHRTEMSRADDTLLQRVIYTLRRYDSSHMVKKEENNE